VFCKLPAASPHPAVAAWLLLQPRHHSTSNLQQQPHQQHRS
jgi:hypothetical protein